MTKVRHFLEQELVFKEKPKHCKFQDLEGQKFGRLAVVQFAEREKGCTYWFCRCDCGNITKVTAGHLKSGATISCGCLQKQRTKEAKVMHGHAGNGRVSPTYRAWKAMKERCDNPNTRNYSDYGGRGIKYCERWKSFENFLADMGEVPKGLSLDRFPDNNGNYCPENCRFATTKEQNNNKRNNRHITFRKKSGTSRN